ncbi:MAG: hypothetical protein M1832_004915 [Thelocarpon impressellum]|nr:MAG: hypothetical protein M1832_004915 [Thelocarpon impressellum]
MSDPTSTSSPPETFPFPRIHSFPPFYTLQPNSSTLQSQFSSWSSLIRAYCRHHRLFRLNVSVALEWDLFHNRGLRKRLRAEDVARVLEFMKLKEGGAAEWVDDGKDVRARDANQLLALGKVCIIWWRRPEEWAAVLERWVDETAQKGTVLTLYELTEGEITRGTEFYGMDRDVLLKSLGVLVKRGKAQVFGQEDQQGVKFF